MTAITVDFESGPPVVAISTEAAVALILEGAHTGAFALPASVRKVAEGAAALESRAITVHMAMSEAALALDAAPGRLAAQVVQMTASSGAVPKTPDIGAEMIRLTADLDRLRAEDRILTNAVGKISDYPSTVIRSEAETIVANLDTALAELLSAARPHSATIAGKVDPAGRNPLAAAMRLDPTGTDALEGLSGRLLALQGASTALERLGRTWTGLADLPAGEPVIALARLAAAPAEAAGG